MCVVRLVFNVLAPGEVYSTPETTCQQPAVCVCGTSGKSICLLSSTSHYVAAFSGIGVCITFPIPHTHTRLWLSIEVPMMASTLTMRSLMAKQS